MSQMGSFVTEYIWDENDLEILKSVLIASGKYIKGVQIPTNSDGKFYPIIAGKISELYEGGEENFMCEILKPIVSKLSHNYKIVVIPENCEPAIINTNDL